MAQTTALGIAPDETGRGVDPLTHRKIIGSLFENPGVITGLDVNGTSGLSYQVSAGCAVLSRGASDGKVEAWWDGGTTGAVPAGDPSNPRIDAVYLYANDLEAGDPDNLVHVGVVSGIPATSPIAPSTPANALSIAQMLLPAGATSTTSATNMNEADYAIPYGTTLGVLLDVTDTTNARVDVSGTPQTIWRGNVTVPTDRTVAFKQTLTMGAIGGGYAGGEGSVYINLLIDGVNVATPEFRLVAEGNAVSQFLELDFPLSKGDHLIEGNLLSATIKQVRKYWSKNNWAGQRLQVVDLGVLK